MHGFLLDSHVPAAVAPALRLLHPNCRIDHIASWNGGILLHAPDEQILSAALAADLALVTYDVSTIPAILNRWSADGRNLPAVVLVISGASRQRDIGGLARSLAHLLQHPENFDPDYPIVYLQLARE